MQFGPDDGTRQSAVMSADEFLVLARKGLPQMEEIGATIDALGFGYCKMRFPSNERFVRPGGTVSGPTMFALADASLWGAVLSAIGPVQLAVTTNLNLNFLRKPDLGKDLIGETRLIKLGKRLAYGESFIFSDGDEEPVAHATGTYSIPPNR
ncbi:MAG: PaaI family thioesterase [Pseudomonadota bacterium]